MPTGSAPRILLCSDAPVPADDIRLHLEQAGYALGRHETAAAELPETTGYQLVVVEGSRSNGKSVSFCRRLRCHLTESFLPILMVTSDATPAARLACLEAGADSYLLRPFAPAELLAQVRAFVRLKDRHDRLSEKTAEVHRVNQHLQRTYQQIDFELELAHRIQRSFLPQSLPELPRLRFAVHYRPRGRVGGDFYDVFRLDEQHLGFYVADAMGHGVPASLLTIFVKKGVRTKEIYGKEYRLIPPGEVLQRLNRELLEQALSENPFITMVYVLFNHHNGTLRFARSGHPYPLYVPHDGEPQLWQVEGSLLGVFETEFPVQHRTLRPGDKMLLYTDGVDAGSFEEHPGGSKSLLECAGRHRQLPIQSFVDRLAQDLFRNKSQDDDLTLFGVEMCLNGERGA
jgi:sigma-B regulation protein RsbU (phosphoserine phosphatase)